MINFIDHNNKKPQVSLSRQDSVINLKYDIIAQLNLGLAPFFSSLLWVDTLLMSDEKHFIKKNLSNWMYIRFMTISNIDPFFLQNYEFGGKYLSIIKNDPLAAVSLLRRGQNIFNENDNITLDMAYNYHIELKQPQKALELYQRLEKIPSVKAKMPIIPALITQLQINLKISNISLYQYIKQRYNLETHALVKKRLGTFLTATIKEILLECDTTYKSSFKCDQLKLEIASLENQ